MARGRALTVDQRFMQMRRERTAAGKPMVPDQFQGVTLTRLRDVLASLDLGDDKIVQAAFAMLDDETPSLFSRAPAGSTFASGARTSMIASHIGYLQQPDDNLLGKIDREGRDFWIKPLRDVGAVDAVTLDEGNWVDGHIAKNPNCSYRLNTDFVAILKAPGDGWRDRLTKWAEQNRTAARMAAQADMAKAAASIPKKLDGHAALIAACIDIYAPRFLGGFQVLYKDDADGDRISDAERAAMAGAGVELTLADAMPDVFLWNPETDWLWVIEAVTSDGEVDPHKVRQLTALKDRYGKKGIGFTTAYNAWRDAARRQSAVRNIEIGTYIWLLEDPTRQMLVESFDQSSGEIAASIVA